MKHRPNPIFRLVVLLLLAAPLHLQAEIGAIDDVPAATLLLPYFEVGLESCAIQPVTLFSINNASAEPAIAHVTLWTKLARPTLDFDVYLTGYDVVTIHLGELFIHGTLPRTGPNFDPGDDPISPNAPGQFSNPDAAPGGCDFPLPAQIPASLLRYIRAAHTGFPVPNGFENAGLCASPDQGVADPSFALATGYITVDVVNDCSLLFPGSPNYFSDGGLGIAANANQLWGDYFIVNPDLNLAHGDPLVHIEAADSVANGFWSPGDYTFYGRYLLFDASDNREPLATTWAIRYFAGTVGAFNDDSDIFCWRDSGLDDSGYFPCGTIPAPYPLSQTQIVIFDEQENPVVVEGSPFSPPPVAETVLPCACATTRANAGDFGPIFDFGWFYLNLNTSTGSAADPVKQSHVTSAHQAAGLFSVGYEAVHLDSALDKTFSVTTAPANLELGP